MYKMYKKPGMQKSHSEKSDFWGVRYRKNILLFFKNNYFDVSHDHSDGIFDY